MNNAKANHQIKLVSAENVIQAAGYADQVGLPLNRHLTISWEHAQCIGRVQDIQARFLERFSKWTRYHGGVPAYVWSMEKGPVLGYHSHIFCHVPSVLLADFKKMIPRWIDGEPDQSGATSAKRAPNTMTMAIARNPTEYWTLSSVLTTAAAKPMAPRASRRVP